MRKISLEQDVVDADLVEQAARRGLFEPVTRIDVAREIFRRQAIELRMLGGNVVALVLVIHRFEHERNPADAALDRDEFNFGIAREHA